MSLTLIPLEETYAVWQPPMDHVVNIADYAACEFFTVSRTEDELSVVCPIISLPKDLTGKIEQPWKCFRVGGQLDFALVGILAQISTVLAESKISLFAISTFDTDYILVKEEKFEEAKRALATKFEVAA